MDISAPSADRTRSDADNRATFVMSNVVPQAPKLNRNTWRLFESYCQGLVKKAPGRDLFIVAGPLGAGGIGEHGLAQAIGPTGEEVVVPAQCWKVVLVTPPGTRHPDQITATNSHAIAVIMPNTQDVDRRKWHEYRVAVQDVERATGMRFFPHLRPEVSAVLKAEPDRTPIGGASLSARGH